MYHFCMFLCCYLSLPDVHNTKFCLYCLQFCVHADKRQMLQELTRSLQQRPTKAHVLWELAGCICSAVGAERYRLYLAERGDPEILNLYLGHDGRYVVAIPGLWPQRALSLSLSPLHIHHRTSCRPNMC